MAVKDDDDICLNIAGSVGDSNAQVSFIGYVNVLFAQFGFLLTIFILL